MMNRPIQGLNDSGPGESASAPLVTFLLLAYNQASYIEEAMRGALAQTYSPLEIIVSDDRSSDDTFAIAQRIAGAYSGPHRLTVRRTERNGGLIAHLCNVMREVQGELVVAAAGDDVSFPERVERVAAAWIANGRQSGSIFSRFQTIDENGTIVSIPMPASLRKYQLADLPPSILEEVSVGTIGCAHAWTRDLFELFGDIDPRAIHEDVTIPLRSLLVGSFSYLSDELVLYRLRPGSLSRHVFSNHRERASKMARYWLGRVANYEQFESDARKAIELGRVDPTAVEPVLRSIRQKAFVARRNMEFLQAGTVARFRIVLGSWRRVPWRLTLKWLVLAAAPWSYRLRLR